MKIIPVILSGGFGTRLWPLSRQMMPKQFLKNLFDNETLFNKALKLVINPDLFAQPIVITHAEHKLLVLNEFEILGIVPHCIILEPCSKNTAIAIISACIKAMSFYPDEKITLLIIPSDHLITPRNLFEQSIINATEMVTDKIVTFGIEPDFSATNYGYIKKGVNISPHCFTIDEFIEKPNEQIATQLFQSGAYLWNAGILLFQAHVFMQECIRYLPTQVDIATHAIAHAKQEDLFCIVNTYDYQEAQKISIDHGLLEKTKHTAVTILQSDWSDVGDFNAIYKIDEKDANHNVVRGNVELHNTTNSLIYAHDSLIACIGLNNLAVIATNDAILIADQSQTADIKLLVNNLLKKDKKEARLHSLTQNKKILLIISNCFFINVGLDIFLRQLPKRIPTWIDFDFEITDSLQKRKTDHYDFIIFYTDYKFGPWNYQPYPFLSEIYRIKCKKVLFVGFESNTVDGYNPVYPRLFQEWPYRDFEIFVLQKDFDHPRYHVLDFIPYPSYLVIGDHNNILDYDFLSNNSPKKEKLLTIVSSNETYARAHQQRIEFSQKIKAYYKDKIDFFGRGFNTFVNKYYTLSPYKYMIVLENGIEENYWTEKLSDCYLAECYPIYFGCPNITDFFDKDSLTIIDIYDLTTSIDVINQVIADNLFEKRYNKIMEAKKLCLTKYNLFNTLRKCCLQVE